MVQVNTLTPTSSPYTVYWKFVTTQGGTPSIKSVMEENPMEAFLSYIKVWLMTAERAYGRALD